MPEILNDTYLLFTFVFKQALSDSRCARHNKISFFTLYII